MKDFRAPLLVGITIPTSLVVSMLFFYILHISMNIISLSGIILGVGMTVDNSIIVIDNITQHRKRLLLQKQAQALAIEKFSNKQAEGNRQKAEASNIQTAQPSNSAASNFQTAKPSNNQAEGKRQKEEASNASIIQTAQPQTLQTTETKETSLSILESACASGTNEIFMPLLSSALTNCAVFIPLIFISGIAGAMFYDQAMAVTIGLLVSLGVSVTLLPVYYRLIYRNKEGESQLKFMKRINLLNFEVLYMSGFRFVMRNQILSVILVISCLAGSFIYVSIFGQNAASCYRQRRIVACC